MSIQQKNEGGQFILELALVIPLLILIFMGIWQFGRISIINQREVMAVRHGAWLKAHTNISHNNIKKEMEKFLLKEKDEKMYIELKRKSSVGFLDISSSLDGILNKLTGVYDVSMEYKLKTLVPLKDVLPGSIYIKENCVLPRNSWANLGDTIKEVFKIE